MPRKFQYLSLLYLVFFCSFARAPLASAQSDIIEIKENDPNGLVLSLKPVEVDLQSYLIDGQVLHLVSMPHHGVTGVPGKPMLPTVSALIRVPADTDLKVTVLENEYEDVPEVKPLPVPFVTYDFASSGTFHSYKQDDSVYNIDAFWPEVLVRANEMGHMRGQPIARIQMNRVQYNAVTKILRVHKKLVIRVTWSRALNKLSESRGTEKSLFEELVAHKILNPRDGLVSRQKSATLDSDLSKNDWYNPQFAYYKILLDEEGIYSLSQGDLRNAGLGVDLVDLDRLKIFNQGKQIPLWVSGPEGSRFTPQHEVHFYGNRLAGADGYYNIHTDTNAYWLTADGEPGSRYQVVSEAKSGPNPASFYWERIHLERDNLFHRSNGSSAIDDGEGWIWRYFFDNDREIFNFEINGLLESVEFCSLRVRVVGTTRDPVNPDHHILLSINNEVVGDTFFDERNEFIGTFAFPTNLLKQGRNQFQLQLVADTGAQVNQIYLDWVEITYPRVHAAQLGNLRFQTEGSDLFSRYAVVNFSSGNISILDPSMGRMWLPGTNKASIFRVESGGFDDGKFLTMNVDFEPMNFNTRGHNLLAINPKSGQREAMSFDTFVSEEAATAMANYISSLPDSTIVLAGIVDDGSARMNESAYLALESLGSALARNVGGRDSWAMIGWKGAVIGAVKETLSPRFSGPAVAKDTLSGGHAFRFRTTFTDSTLAPFYYAVSDDAVKQVKEIVRDRSSNLLARTNSADYLIITHANFISAAERLGSYRTENNGFRTMVVDVQDVYDEFNAGIVSPRAIKGFLSFTYRNWQSPSPSFVLLFGDASWDPKKLIPGSLKESFVPAYGSLVSDNWLVTLDGADDILPDMFIGRIPAETAEQAEIAVDKIIAYESLSFNSWNKRFLFMNGGENSTEQGVFLSQANTLIRNFIESAPLGGQAVKLNKTTNEIITQSLRRQAADEIRSGVLWVNFIGHAGSRVWDIDIGQPSEWENSDTFPFITGMSCHSARYANPFFNSLSEDYFINPAGAAAYWGAAGFGYVTQDFFLLEGLFSAISVRGIRSIGAATTFAKLHLWEQVGQVSRSRYVINQYTLIGDPAMSLVLPVKPELAVRSEEIRLDKDLLLTTDISAQLSTTIHNFGLVPALEESVRVQLSAFDSESNQSIIREVNVAPFSISDTVTTVWGIPEQAGNYLIQVQVDPADVIEEEDEFNNIAQSAVIVYSSDITPIKPIAFAGVGAASPALITNNSRVMGRVRTYFFEIDSTTAFDSPLAQQSPTIPEGAPVTQWQPKLEAPGVYYWRVRTFDDSNHGPWETSSFTYEREGSSQWQQGSSPQFAANYLRDVLPEGSRKVQLATNPLVYQGESAGLVDGNYAILSRNREILGSNDRGHNVVVFDDSDGSVIATESFDTYKFVSQSDSLSEFISQLNDGQLVLVAIRDDGTGSITENAHSALESIGSQLTRQVDFRDSWAIIGRKGAPMGSVPEVLKKSGEGPATVVDTLFRFSKSGSMISTEIGPALNWQSAEFDYQVPSAESRIDFQVVGLNARTGTADTLRTGIQDSQVDLSDIDAKSYPKLKLIANLFSDDGLSTPQLNSWSVDYTPPSDLVVGRGSVTLRADTVLVGDDIDLRLKIGNFGLSPSDSFLVTFAAGGSGPAGLELSQFYTEGLSVDELKEFEASFSSKDLSGQTDITVTLDPKDEIVELHDSNNDFTFSVWVNRDTLSPEIRVTFDSHAIAGGDFVAANPQVSVEIRDAANLAFSDTAQIAILLNERKVPYGPGPGQVQLLEQQNPKDPGLRAISVFEPSLREGTHTIEVIARDVAGNLRYFQAEVRVSEDFLLANVMNYPNPFRNETDFTYILTQEADLVKLKIYTVAGRLIQESDFLPTRAGFNQFRWDGRDFDGDTLSNGVYFYKIIARKGEQQMSVVEKLVVMR